MLSDTWMSLVATPRCHSCVTVCQWPADGVEAWRLLADGGSRRSRGGAPSAGSAVGEPADGSAGPERPRDDVRWPAEAIAAEFHAMWSIPKVPRCHCNSFVPIEPALGAP